jgi:hypothetical protein
VRRVATYGCMVPALECQQQNRKRHTSPDTEGLEQQREGKYHELSGPVWSCRQRMVRAKTTRGRTCTALWAAAAPTMRQAAKACDMTNERGRHQGTEGRREEGAANGFARRRQEEGSKGWGTTGRGRTVTAGSVALGCDDRRSESCEAAKGMQDRNPINCPSTGGCSSHDGKPRPLGAVASKNGDK